MSAVPPESDLAVRARSIRTNAVRIAQVRGRGYIGQALGCAEILACLFYDVMRRTGPEVTRDRFVLSPGHYALGLYAVLADLGAYDFEELRTYGMDGSRIEESPLEGIPGFEITAGSLAQGLSQAVGIALGSRLQERGARVFCLISDGELQEGQTWEAVLAAAHWKLSNLVVILDRNRRQVDGLTEDVTRLEPIADKFSAFGFSVASVDAHDIDAVRSALQEAADERQGPAVVICNSTLGRGVTAFENAEYPHYVRADDAIWEQALAELGA